METKMKWYQTTGGIIALLILFFPVGLFLMWKHATWNKTAKWIVTGVFAFFILIGAVTPDSAPSTSSSQESATSVNQATEPTQALSNSEQNQPQEPTNALVGATNTPAAQSATVSQQNAVRKAQSYLGFSGFSRDGLVAQLEYEKFSHEDAVYGADNSGANWNEQAAKKAKSYMDMMGYSRDGLIEQLKYEKFTQEQAEYGASAVGL